MKFLIREIRSSLHSDCLLLPRSVLSSSGMSSADWADTIHLGSVHVYLHQTLILQNELETSFGFCILVSAYAMPSSILSCRLSPTSRVRCVLRSLLNLIPRPTCVSLNPHIWQSSQVA